MGNTFIGGSNYYIKTKELDSTYLVEMFQESRYYEHKRIYGLLIPKNENSKALIERWTFCSTDNNTHYAFLASKELMPEYYKRRKLIGIKINEDLFLSAPDMYDFLVAKPGSKVSMDWQLSYHFC